MCIDQALWWYLEDCHIKLNICLVLIKFKASGHILQLTFGFPSYACTMCAVIKTLLNVYLGLHFFLQVIGLLDIVLVIKSVSHSQTDSTNAHFCPVHYTGGERLTQSCVIHLLGADFFSCLSVWALFWGLCVCCFALVMHQKVRIEIVWSHYFIDEHRHKSTFFLYLSYI